MDFVRWILLLATTATAHANTSVMQVPDIAFISAHPNPTEVEYLKAIDEQYGLRPLGPEFESAVTRGKAALLNLVREIHLPKDGSNPLRIVIVDGREVQAMYVRDSTGKMRVLGITLGALARLENDSQTKFVLGHELEHGTSELAKHIDQTYGSRSLGMFETAYVAQLHKAVESEVDIKSVIDRVHRTGGDPY